MNVRIRLRGQFLVVDQNGPSRRLPASTGLANAANCSEGRQANCVTPLLYSANVRAADVMQ